MFRRKSLVPFILLLFFTLFREAQGREKASVAYHCIRSDNNEGLVSIRIDTKSVTYRHIQAIDETYWTYPWCDGTDIDMSEPEKFININIRVTETVLAQMQQGQCAGQLVAGGLFEWRIALQEREDNLMPDDQIVIVRCNFNDAETLPRPGGAKVDEQMATATSKPKETGEVVLELVGFNTEEKPLWIRVGSLIQMKVQFGLSEDSLVKSVFPYDCEATTADGAARFPLLDSNGCQVEGSPVQPFVHTDDSNTIITPPFRAFKLSGDSEVFFQCSFIFCHDTSCGVGCVEHMDRENKVPYMKSTRGDL